MIRSLALSRGLLVSTACADATKSPLGEDLKKASGGERSRSSIPPSSLGISRDSYNRSEHPDGSSSQVSLSMNTENRATGRGATSGVPSSLTRPRVSSGRLAVSINRSFHPARSSSHTDTSCQNSNGNVSARLSSYSHGRGDWQEEKGKTGERKPLAGSLFISSPSSSLSSSPFSSSSSTSPPPSFAWHDKTDHTLHYRKTPAPSISIQTQQPSLPHGGPRTSHQTTALGVCSIKGKAAVDEDENKRNRTPALLSDYKRDNAPPTSLQKSSAVISPPSSSSSSTLSHVSRRGVRLSDLSRNGRHLDDVGFTCNEPGEGCFHRERSRSTHPLEEKQEHALSRNIGESRKVDGDTGSVSRNRMTMSMCPEKLNGDENVALRHSSGTAYVKQNGRDDEDVDVLLRELQIAQSKLRIQLEEHLRVLRYQLHRMLQNPAFTAPPNDKRATISPVQ